MKPSPLTQFIIDCMKADTKELLKMPIEKTADVKRRGRPPKGDDKGVQINLRVHQRTYSLIAEQAEQQGVTLAVYARSKLLEALAREFLGEVG